MVVGEVWFLFEKWECDKELINDRDIEDITELVREDDGDTKVVREDDGDAEVAREDNGDAEMVKEVDNGDIKDITEVVMVNDVCVIKRVVVSVLVT